MKFVELTEKQRDLLIGDNYAALWDFYTCQNFEIIVALYEEITDYYMVLESYISPVETKDKPETTYILIHKDKMYYITESNGIYSNAPIDIEVIRAMLRYHNENSREKYDLETDVIHKYEKKYDIKINNFYEWYINKDREGFIIETGKGQSLYRSFNCKNGNSINFVWGRWLADHKRNIYVRLKDYTDTGRIYKMFYKNEFVEFHISKKDKSNYYYETIFYSIPDKLYSEERAVVDVINELVNLDFFELYKQIDFEKLEMKNIKNEL